MIKYEIDHELMNNLKIICSTLFKSKQSLFTCQELLDLNNRLNNCKPIAPKSNNKIIEGEVKKVEPKNIIPLPTKPKKDDKK